MYEQHFNFNAPPFSIAPNPRYVYLSPQHREALAHLLYGISLGGGFVVLTGEVGTGKTTLCRCLLEQLPEDVDIALIFNPRLNARELLASLCDELNIANPGEKTSIRRLIEVLNQHLLDAHARGRRTIVLIDEAQNLSFDVLEQIRLLTNLETNVAKLLQIILVGQPELNTLLARPNLRQLSQRITARYHLSPLSLPETQAYITRRLAVSGVTRRIFSPWAVRRIHRLSGGIPRLINLICDRSLLGAYTLDKRVVGSAIVRKAAREILPPARQRRTHFALLATAALLLLAVGLALDPSVLPSRFMGFLNAPTFTQRVNAAEKNAVKAASATRTKPSADAQASHVPALADGPKSAPSEPSALGANPANLAAVGATGQAANPPNAKGGTPPPQAPPVEQTQATPKDQASSAADFPSLIVAANLTREAAMTRLFSAWGSALPVGTADECQFAKQNNLRCLSANGKLALVSKLDHPALLEFVLPDGSKRYATVLAVRGQQWVLGMGQSKLSLEPAKLLPYWRGNFTLLWRPPSDAVGIIKPGKNHASVGWVRQQLNAPAEPGKEALFDDRLRHAIMEFQRKIGLPPDGEVGPMTMIQLRKASRKYVWPSLVKPND